ncbi:MAG: hypothetical protein QM784_36515 [Polyangiaceae bacterium]
MSLRRAQRLWVPFLGIALFEWSVLLFGLVSSWMLLPTVGSALLPWLGERRTNLVELALFGLFLASSCGLHFLFEVTRTELAYGASTSRGAFVSALGRIRAAPLRLLAITAPRLFVGATCLLGAVDFTFIVHRETSPNVVACLGTAFSELAALIAAVAYLDWLRALRPRESACATKGNGATR